MIQAIRLRVIYALHMLAPASLALWHLDRLSGDTLCALKNAFS